jgi:hypothetical protein
VRLSSKNVSFQSGKSVNVFCNASGKPEKEHTAGVVNYVRDNLMVITLNVDELPDWIDDGQLGIDVMFDEMSYREMEFAIKEVMKATDNRVAELRELLGRNRPVHGQPVCHRGPDRTRQRVSTGPGPRRRDGLPVERGSRFFGSPAPQPRSARRQRVFFRGRRKNLG